MPYRQKKVVVIGAGSVGTAYIYALLPTGVAGEIALIDLDENLVEGEILDLSHGLPFIPPVNVKKGSYFDCADADIIVITAGAKQKPGQTRLDLTQKNAQIVRSICQQISKQGSSAVLVIVTNPVDALTYLALKELNWPQNRVIGSGTVLDSARFRYLLSRHCSIDARNIHAYILGEHGDSEIAAWSMSHIAGVQLNEYCRTCGGCDYNKTHLAIAEEVRNSAYHIIDYKGSTYYGIGLSLVRITQTILRNENSVLTVSSLLNGQYGIKDVCISIPCVLAEEGIKRTLSSELTPEELQALLASAQIIRKTIDEIENTDR